MSSAVGSGQLLPGTVARIVKADGSLAGYDEPGELVIKCPSVALGYANNAAAFVSSLEFLFKYLDAFFTAPGTPLSTGVYFSGRIQAANLMCRCFRWVKSGDEVKIDRNGEVWVLDRLKVLPFFHLYGSTLSFGCVL